MLSSRTVFYALHADAIGAPWADNGSLIARGDGAFAALWVSSRFTHARRQVGQMVDCNASQLKYYSRSGGFTSIADRGKFAFPNAAGRAMPPFSRIGMRRG
jgi:hypothetical protein